MSSDVAWDRAAKYMNMLDGCETGGDKVSLMCRILNDHEKELLELREKIKSMENAGKGAAIGAAKIANHSCGQMAEKDKRIVMLRDASSEYRKWVRRLLEPGNGLESKEKLTEEVGYADNELKDALQATKADEECGI